MWLVDVSTQDLKEFVEGSIPPYVALSHRWTAEELSFKEVFKNRIDHSKRGWQKLQNACRVAIAYDVRYIWIDTCCIDKKSSAELSEAINSMFIWYQTAKTCLAYLEDVHVGPACEEEFKSSVWFTRSWTLQELLAPQEVHFYDQNWAYIGSRTSQKQLIEEVTGICEDVLTKDCPIEIMSVAERMSWSAQRVATRSEDVAYDLMGIFGVNMPTLYGEGNKAYLRLQEEILRHSADTSIFFWGYEDDTHRLLANSPADFRAAKREHESCSGTLKIMRSLNMGIEIDDATIIRWDLNVYGLFIASRENEHYALLICKVPGLEAWYRVGIEQVHTCTSYNKEQKVLIVWGSEGQLDTEGELAYGTPLDEDHYGFIIESEAPFLIHLGNLKYGLDSWASSEHACESSGHPNREEVLFDNPIVPASLGFTCQLSEHLRLFVDLSFDFDSRACMLISRSELKFSAWEASIKVKRDWPRLVTYPQYEMCKVPNHGQDDVSYLLRHKYYCFAAIPAEILIADGPIWHHKNTATYALMVRHVVHSVHPADVSLKDPVCTRRLYNEFKPRTFVQKDKNNRQNWLGLFVWYRPNAGFMLRTAATQVAPAKLAKPAL